MELFAYLKYISDRSLTLRDKWELLLRYKIFRSKFLSSVEDRESFVFSLQFTYYKKLLEEKNNKKTALEKTLEAADFDSDLKKLKKQSMNYLYQYSNQHMPSGKPVFTKGDYKGKFLEFMQWFPVIGSSTHSLVRSIASEYLLDYLIIDEASQQDLVPGILCLGCARNVIVVGDSKQLSHISQPTPIIAPEPLYDCEKYSLLNSISEIFGDVVPRTLLKEHYRCHPKIIQFCNKQFYDNELIPMTVDQGEAALSLVTTAPGNHERQHKNQREIESVMAVNENCGYLDSEGPDERTVGFIAPYNNQVKLAEDMLPENVTEATIHKFQGRECNEIIFSTVLDKKAYSQRQVGFVDNPELVNVAVSRAKDKFTLVTGKGTFTKKNQNIAALIRYIQYYGTADSVVESPVISAFDLLYSEYDRSLERLASRLRAVDSRYKSEQILAAVLRTILPQFPFLQPHQQIFLKQLVISDHVDFTKRETEYINNRASCDFVLYYRIGKEPVAVIEVDGGCHDKPEQKERDALKNSILEKVSLPLLRLHTTDSNIEEKLIHFINKSI